MVMAVLSPCALAKHNEPLRTPNFPDGLPVLVRAENTDYADNIVQEEFDSDPEPHTEILDYEIEMEVSENNNDGVSTFSATDPSLYDYEKWRQIYSDAFGSSYVAPNTVNENSATIQGNTNRLVVTETDLYFPGRNGLDLSIRRRHDNQDFGKMTYRRERYGTLGVIRTCYSFLSPSDERIYIAFLSPDDMYRFMYDGAYLCLDDLDTIQTNKVNENGDNFTINYYVFEDVQDRMSSTQSSSSVFYTLDTDIAGFKVQENLEDEISLIASFSTLPLSENEIGSGWYYDVPEVSMHSYYERGFYGDNGNEWEIYYYTAAFRDIYGRVHSFNGSLDKYLEDQDSLYEYTSDLDSDINDGLQYTRHFENKTLNDGTIYNFTVYDAINGLMYYMYSDTLSINSNEEFYVVKVEDNYGNAIDYSYDETDKICKITDTYGREIFLSEQGISYYDAYEAETKSILYTLEELPASTLNNNSILRNKPVIRFTVTNSIGEDTIYDIRSTCLYQTIDTSLSDRTIYEGLAPSRYYSKTHDGYNIERITYSSGLVTEYTYTILYPSGQKSEIIRSVYAVSEVSSTDGTRIANRRTYTFEEYYDSYYGKSVIDVTETDASNNITELKYDLNGKLLTITKSPSGDESTKYVEEYEYDDDGMPSKKTSYHKINHGYSADNVEEYYYNGTFLSLKYVNELCINYTYHTGNVRSPKTITYSKKNTDSTYTAQYIEETTLNSNGSVEYKYTKRADGSLINQQKYEYNTYGDVSAVYTWISAGTDGVADMTDKYKVTKQDMTLNEDDTLNVRIYVEDVLDADGVNIGDYSMTYQLDMRGNPVKQTDSYGKISTIEYDDISRPVRYTLPDNSVVTVEYNRLNNYTMITDQIGGKTRYIYDDWNNVKEKQYLDGSNWITTEEYTYDAYNRVYDKILYRSATEGKKERYTYDFLNRVYTKDIYELSDASSYIFSTRTDYDILSDGTILESTWNYGADIDGTYNIYDAYGRLLSTSRGSQSAPKETYTYDYMDRVLTKTDREGGVTQYIYNEIENIEAVIYPDYYIEQTLYDLAGRAVGVWGTYQSESYAYDSLDRVIETQDNRIYYDYPIKKTYYDFNSNVVKTKTKITGENYRVEEYRYDDVGKLLGQILIGDTQNQVTQYQYDNAGRMLKMITGLTQYSAIPTGGKTTTYEYNAQNLISKITDPLGNSEHYTYDRQGNTLTKTDRKGVTTSYTYNTLGIESETVSGETPIIYTYLLDCLEVNRAQGNKFYAEVYDSEGRLWDVYDGDDSGYLYTYDDNSNVVGITVLVLDELFNMSYTYDSANKLTSMTEGDTTYSYSYGPDRDLNWITSDEYNAYFDVFSGVLYQKRNFGPNDTDEELSYDSEYLTNNEYTYTADCNIASELRTDETIVNYTYDKMGRLVDESAYETVDVSEEGFEPEYEITDLIYSYSYTYDASGNRASMEVSNVDNPYTETYTYDANNRMTSRTKTVGETVTTTTYTYDNNGNLITEQTGESVKAYTYDKKNRLIGYTADGVTASYTYSLTGKRESKTVNGETIYYAWLGDNLIAEYNEDGVTKKYVYDQTGILKAYTGDTTNPELYYLKDGHGNAETLLKPNGTVYEDYQYTAFGTTLENSTLDNPFRYCGEYYDTETGLIYLRNRYYSADVGRFITEDPIRDGLNWYVYCGNDPVNFVDPLGLAPGDKFDSRNDAAADFGCYIGYKSIITQEEFASAIYERVEENGDVYYTYDNPRNELETHEERNMSFYISWYGESPVAIAHTHGAYDIATNNKKNIFSSPDNVLSGNPEMSDTYWSDKLGIDYYLVAPTGELKVYVSNSGNYEGDLIRSDMPKDFRLSSTLDSKKSVQLNFAQAINLGKKLIASI